MYSSCHSAIALALAAWLVLSPVAPQAHVHEADGHHSSAIVHRHVEAHDHDGVEISHGEGWVIWLDDVGRQQATYEFAVVQAVVVAHVATLQKPKSWVAASTIDAAPAHGPPRSSTSLRAPPLPSL